MLQTILDHQDRRDAGDGCLRPWLDHADARVRAWAARGLGLVHDQAAAPALARILRDDPVPEVRVNAAAAIGWLGTGADALVAALSNDASVAVRRQAAVALGEPWVRRLPTTGDRPSLGGSRTAGGGQENQIAAPENAAGAHVRGQGEFANLNGSQALRIDAALEVALHDEDGGVRHGAAWALARRAHGAAAAFVELRRGQVARLLLLALRREVDAATRGGIVAALRTVADPIAIGTLTDLAVEVPRDASERALITDALGGLAAAIDAAHSADHANPAIRAALRRHLRSSDAELAAAAANAMLAGWPDADLERTADAHALLDAMVAARARSATTVIAEAAVCLRPTGEPCAELERALELGTVAGDASVRAGCLGAFALLRGSDALRALRHGLTANDPRVRAGALRGVARLPRLHREANDLVWAALFDRSSRVAAVALATLATTGGSAALLALHARDPDLLAALADVLRPPFDAALAPRLLARALGAEFEPAARALAVRAASLLADAEDDTMLPVLRAVVTDGDVWSQHALTADGVVPKTVWPESCAPRLGTEFDWRWLHAPPQLIIRTTAGSFTVQLAADLAPIHVFHLLRRVATQTDLPTHVVDGIEGCVLLGQRDRTRATATQLLRMEPGSADPTARGLVGFVPTPLPDLDGIDLFITRKPRPDWSATRTIVGQVADGMGVVDALQPGDRILHIEVRPGSD